MTLRKKGFKSIVGKGKKCMSSFSHCVLSFQEQISIIPSNLFCCQQVISVWMSLKFFCVVMIEKKWEIENSDCKQHFLLFPQCFQKQWLSDHGNSFVWGYDVSFIIPILKD